jgi:hypothetical protein
MLRPYICVACEKVIIDQPLDPQLGHPPPASGTASLISLFSKMLVEVPFGTEIPKNAVGPKDWVIFSAWDVEKEDEKRSYSLCTSILYPDGTQFGAISKVHVPIIWGQRSQMMVRIVGFPLGQPGFHTVRTWIEENEKVVHSPIEFKIELQIVYKHQEQPQPQIQ